VLDGHWKKLLVFVGADFLLAGAYHFAGTKLVFSPETAVCCRLDTVTVVDPLDGLRWTYRDGRWDRSG
jgi:hypothetical protein